MCGFRFGKPKNQQSSLGDFLKPELIKAHMRSALNYAALSKCKRKQVGCIVVKGDSIISIGYNGTPPGWDNNCENPDNTTNDLVLHAEENAIAKLAKSTVSSEGASLFITVSPCIKCARLLLVCGIESVYYLEDYRSSDGLDFLKKSKIKIEQVIL